MGSGPKIKHGRLARKRSQEGRPHNHRPGIPALENN
jgi:hypothetical protein